MPDPIALLLPQPGYLLLLLLILCGPAFHFRRFRLLALGLCAWCWLLLTPGLANLATVALEGRPAGETRREHPPGETPLIVVLASGQMQSRDGQPNPRLDTRGWERLQSGIRLWRRAGGTLLLTGGPDLDPERSLAALMRNIAIESGVPPGQILISPRSSTTYEDLFAAREQIERHPGPVWLVTSALHMPRALAITERLHLTVHPYPCDYRQIEAPTWRAWLPDNGAPEIWYDVLHEVIGREYYRLRGWSA